MTGGGADPAVRWRKIFEWEMAKKATDKRPTHSQVSLARSVLVALIRSLGL